ncbi:MAG: hypothetical protein GVY19_10375 [Bacteroidetes bacterium]|jgi:hypothetical protein|nr:hypothetical protein [Bacteroidota bacterium]
MQLNHTPVNLIYFMRARTEERHLSMHPTYVKYATLMNYKGVFSGLFKKFPVLAYNAERYKTILNEHD